MSGRLQLEVKGGKMEIGPVKENALLTNQPKQESKEVKTEGSAKKKDTVSISLQARKRLADLADTSRTLSTAKTETETELGQTRLDQVRERIANGYYDRNDVRIEIADKLIGHLEED